MTGSEFQRDGYVGPMRLFTPKECRRIAAYLRRNSRPAPAGWKKGRAVHERFLYDLAIRPALLDRVAELVGDEVILWGVSPVIRQPHQTHAWHSDIESCASEGGFVSVWIGIENTSRESSLQIITRSHRLGKSVQEVRADAGMPRSGATPDALLGIARRHEPDAELVIPDMSDGEAIFFDGRLWHGSDNRNRFGTRLALILQFAAADRPVRIPDLSQLDWPFRLREEPLPPVIVVRGSDSGGPNRVVPAPPPIGDTPMVETAIHSFDFPLGNGGPSKPWQPFPAFRGPTRTTADMKCHASVLVGGHTPHPPHAHIEEELLLPLHGEVELTIPTGRADASPRKERIRPGSFVFYPAWQYHTIRNPGTSPVAYLMFKWQAPVRPSGETLGVQILHYDEPAPDNARGFWTHHVLNGPTGCLGKLHAHLTQLAPGAGYEPHRDAHDVAIVVLEGVVEALGRRVGTNSVVYIAAGEMHGMRNPGDVPARYLVFEFHSPGTPSLEALPVATRLKRFTIRSAKRVLRPVWRRVKALIFIALLVPFAGCSDDQPVADLILRNGKVVTVDETIPDGSAIAVKGGRILAVGSETDIGPFAGTGTQIVDLDGKLAIPGLIEGHAHFMSIGDAQLILDLTTPNSWGEIVDMVAEAVTEAEPGEWIRGRGWHQDKWTGLPDQSYEGFPVHRSLSAVSPDNPVVLTHASGHASFVNQKAMDASRISSETPDPPGGEILLGADGQPTGLLRETAQRLVRVPGAETPEEADEIDRRRARLASAEVLRNGITSFHDAGSSLQTIDLFKKLADEGLLPVRLYVMIRASNEVLAERLPEYRTIGYGDNHLTVRAVKLSIDGALGARGAWLLQPYSDAPHLSGLNLIPITDVRETARLALRHNYQLAVHAIGDRANREVLNIFHDTFATRQDSDTLRWRIEHAQHIAASDIPRFGELGVIASMQGVHCTSDASWVPDRLGDARSEEGAYVWRKLLDSGAVVTNGTDAPVERVDPIASFYSSMTRRLSDGSVFYPDQQMTRMEALRSYTINNAYAAFEEDIKGSLTPGKLADITVLTQDILTIDDELIPETKVAMTIVGGKILYDSTVDEADQ